MAKIKGQYRQSCLLRDMNKITDDGRSIMENESEKHNHLSSCNDRNNARVMEFQK